MTTKHTPGKLFPCYYARVGPGEQTSHWSLKSGETTVANCGQSAANAARLALCWNMHDEMAELTRLVVRYAGHTSAGNKPSCTVPELYGKASAVLAKLEGGAS